MVPMLLEAILFPKSANSIAHSFVFRTVPTKKRFRAYRASGASAALQTNMDPDIAPSKRDRLSPAHLEVACERFLNLGLPLAFVSASIMRIIVRWGLI